jgi:hypothetical protein
LTIAQVKGTTYRIAVAALNRDFPGAFALSSRIKTRKFSLQKRLRTCGKIRSAAKRKRCRTSARQKNAVLKCQKKLDAAKQTKCVKAARKRF